MATVDDKENVAPATSSDPLQRKDSTPSPKKVGRRGRSKSIGPGGLHEPEGTKQEVKEDDAKNRRKSTYVPATKSIISNDTEKAERQAARRKTLANRRVSFALEATLHTWDVVEFMRDQTTSTDSSDNTRRTERDSPYKRSFMLDSDPPSTPPEHDGGVGRIAASPAQQQQKKRRRSSTGPPVKFNDVDDAEDSSGLSDAEDSGDEDAEGSDDDTGTAMSLDVDNNTVQSLAESEASSTGSSARLEAALRQAAETAGTRGIEYDEYGDGEASMELASEEVTNAFKPWVEQRAANQPPGSASLDQENVNPFSPAFKAQLVSGTVNRPATVEEENTGDMSMDVTRAVGGIVSQPAIDSPSSQLLEDGTMDLTQAVGKIQRTAQPQSPQTRNGQKRRRSTADTGSPGVVENDAQAKRRRSSMPRQSLGDDTMDLTTAIGGVQNVAVPAKPERRRGAAKRRSSGVVSDQDEATMDFTQAIGGVKPANLAENTASSLDSNEELTMELTTVLGGIKAAEKAAIEGPVTPQNHSPSKDAQNTTPKDQERFKDAPDSGPKKLLTPIFQKQVLHSAGKKGSSGKSRKSMSPAVQAKASVAFAEPAGEEQPNARTPKVSPAKDHATPVQSPGRRRSSATPDSALKMQLDAQLQGSEPSPTVQKQQRSSPTKAPSTPERVDEPTQDGRRLAESIKLMSTPRKETLKHTTPRTQPRAQEPSPKPVPTSKGRATPKGKATAPTSPARQLNEDLDKIESSEKPIEKIALQQFLDFAGIRFMDLTTTKRRMTHVTTPSKAKKAGEFHRVPNEEAETNLESAILAAGCTLPELEIYEHACHDLKHHISDGKRVVKDLEDATAKANPPLLKAYMAAGPKRKAAIDSQMRDMKTQARLRSREMWYSWRTQLMEDLMRGLQGVGEGLIRDDEVLGQAEGIVEANLPGLVQREAVLRGEAQRLEVVAGSSEEEKEELDAAREKLVGLDGEVEERQRILEELKREMEGLQTRASDLEENKEEFVAAIREAERVKEVCRGVSTNEVNKLQESITHLEETTGWTITSASSAPATVTMTYKSHLQLFFHPSAFASHQSSCSGENSPISLTYTSATAPGTTLRFFLQLLRAALQALHQPSTPLPSLLHLVSSGWETALTLAETERRLRLQAPTESRILSDERLMLETSLLLPAVRTKVRVAFNVAASVDVGGEGVSAGVDCAVSVVYGEPYNEVKMTEFVEREVGGGLEGWEGVVAVLRERLVARGRKG